MSQPRTHCEMCGKCCRFEIPLTLMDIHRMAKHRDQNDEKLFKMCVDKKAGSSGLFKIRKKTDRKCVFLLDDEKCAVHGAKPRACEFYFCSSGKEDAIPWTATYSTGIERARLWEHSLSAVVTKKYIEFIGTAWNSEIYNKAIVSIFDNVLSREGQKLKLGRNEQGRPVHMLYNCAECDKHGEYTFETPITLNDIHHIRKYLQISWKSFFDKYVDANPSKLTGGLKLKRDVTCVFFDRDKHCIIKEVRPMHCRFTPCPKKTSEEDKFDSLFLGSGTVEEQFGHQVSLSLTRQYVAQQGVGYNKRAVSTMLETFKDLMSNAEEFNKFCTYIAPFRFVNDTL